MPTPRPQPRFEGKGRLRFALTLLLCALAAALVEASGWRDLGGNYVASVPVEGSIELDREYYVTVRLGTPPQTLSVQLSTGMSDTVVYAPNCTECPFADSVFDCDVSTSCVAMPCNTSNIVCESCTIPYATCQFNDAMRDGSQLQGLVVRDSLVLSSNFTTSVLFGLVTENGNANAPPRTLRDGVLGLGPGFQGSVWNSSSVLARLLDAGHASPRFALCLRDHGGALLLGTTPPPSRLVRLPRSPLASRSYFSVSLQALYVESELVTDDAELLNGRYGGAVFDLGVSPLILPRKVFDEVAYYVHRYVCAKNNVSVACYAVNNLFAGKCENLPQSDLALFPVLAFNVSGLPFALVLRPNEYIVSGATCRVVMLSPTDWEYTLFGNVLLRHYLAQYDYADGSIALASRGDSDALCESL